MQKVELVLPIPPSATPAMLIVVLFGGGTGC